MDDASGDLWAELEGPHEHVDEDDERGRVLADLPPELAFHPGPFVVSGTDRETGESFAGEVARDDLALGFADRRALEDDA